MPENFEINIDLDKFRKSFGDDISAVIRGVNVGMSKATEEMLGLIKREKLGPMKWDPRNQNDAQRSISFAKSVAVAKKEGFTDFRRGQRTGLKGRKGKRVNVGRGSGWSRVLELQPRMASFRPLKAYYETGPGQTLWIQSGTLRKTTTHGIIGRGFRQQTAPASISLSLDALSLAYIQITQPYGQQLEAGKYKFAEPAVREYLRTDELRRHIIREIARAIKEGAAGAALVGV